MGSDLDLRKENGGCPRVRNNERKIRNKQYKKTTQTGEKRALVFGAKTCVKSENVNEMKTGKSAVKQGFGLKWGNVLLATCHSEAWTQIKKRD